MALRAATIGLLMRTDAICRPTREIKMKESHNKAAELHESAAKSHRAPPSLMAGMSMPKARSTRPKLSSMRRAQTTSLRRRIRKALNRSKDLHREAGRHVGLPV